MLCDSVAKLQHLYVISSSCRVTMVTGHLPRFADPCREEMWGALSTLNDSDRPHVQPA